MSGTSYTFPKAIAAWHRVAQTRDAAGLDALLDDEVVFQSPVAHTPQRGKAATKMYLGAAVSVLGGDHFRYVGEWVSLHSAVLEFVVEIDGVEINGVDIIGWTAEGRIDSFKVMVRPLRAIQTLQQKMGAMLAALQQQPQQ